MDFKTQEDSDMIKLFIGGKGSGKTKTLIELVNNATAASNGSVVCIEKGDNRSRVTHNSTGALYWSEP